MNAVGKTIAIALAMTAGSTALATEKQLNSGKSVELLELAPLHGNGWSALNLAYRTKIPSNNIDSLRQEADELWQFFFADAEHSGLSNAIISAVSPPPSTLRTNFVYEKADGAWHTLEPNDRKKLDTAFVTELLARLDLYDQNNDVNALLLYLDNNWSITLISAVRQLYL